MLIIGKTLFPNTLYTNPEVPLTRQRASAGSHVDLLYQRGAPGGLRAPFIVLLFYCFIVFSYFSYFSYFIVVFPAAADAGMVDDIYLFINFIVFSYFSFLSYFIVVFPAAGDAGRIWSINSFICLAVAKDFL